MDMSIDKSCIRWPFSQMRVWLLTVANSNSYAHFSTITHVVRGLFLILMPTPTPFFKEFHFHLFVLPKTTPYHVRLAAGLSIAAFFSVVATFMVLAGGKPFTDKSARVLPFIYLDLALMLLLAVIIAKRLVELWVERRRGLAGSKLHIQIVGLFSFITIIPAILVAGFAAIFINIGVQSWFGEPVPGCSFRSKRSCRLISKRAYGKH